MSADRTPAGPPAADLAAAYRRAVYRVETPDGAIDLRVGRRSVRLERWLEGLGASRWGFVSAVNPASRQLSEAENAERTGRLERRLAALGYRSFPGVGLDPEGSWPEEPSFLVLAVGISDLAGLAAEFGQAAFLAGETGRPARLVWLAGSGAPSGELRRPSRARPTRARRRR